MNVLLVSLIVILLFIGFAVVALDLKAWSETQSPWEIVEIVTILATQFIFIFWAVASMLSS